MAKHLVLGIISNCEPKHVEQTIDAAGIDRKALQVLTPDQPTPEHERSPLSFVHLFEFVQSNSLADDMTRGTGVIPDFGGTSVPGLGGEERDLGILSHPDLSDNFAGMNIPSGAAELYNDAIEDGRCVLVYSCEDDESACQANLQRAGAIEVRVFNS
jgi:hypothetical protein